GLAGDVGSDELAVDLVRGRLPAGLVEVGDHHFGAFAGQPAGGGQPDPAGATGDHGDPAVEAPHSNLRNPPGTRTQSDKRAQQPTPTHSSSPVIRRTPAPGPTSELCRASRTRAANSRTSALSCSGCHWTPRT